MEYIAAFIVNIAKIAILTISSIVAFCSLLILGAVIIDCLIDIKNLLKRKN